MTTEENKVCEKYTKQGQERMNTCTRQDSTRKERRREQVAISVDADIIVFWDVRYKSRKLPGTWCHTTDNNDPNIYHSISNITVDGAFKYMNQF